MKLKGSLNYRDETTSHHHLDAAREILRDRSRQKFFFSKVKIKDNAINAINEKRDILTICEKKFITQYFIVLWM